MTHLHCAPQSSLVYSHKFAGSESSFITVVQVCHWGCRFCKKTRHLVFSCLLFSFWVPVDSSLISSCLFLIMCLIENLSFGLDLDSASAPKVCVPPPRLSSWLAISTMCCCGEFMKNPASPNGSPQRVAGSRCEGIGVPLLLWAGRLYSILRDLMISLADCPPGASWWGRHHSCQFESCSMYSLLLLPLPFSSPCLQAFWRKMAVA